MTVAAGATLTMAGDLPLTMDWGRLDNHGTFVKSAGAGAGYAYYVNSDGVVRSSSGTLRIERASALRGDVVVDGSAVFETSGGSNDTVVFDGTTATGAGLVRLNGYTRSQNDARFANLTHQGSRFEAGDTSVSGTFIRNGGTFEAGSATFTFDGTGQQQLTLNVATTFANLVVAAGALLVETVSADNGTVTGTTRVLGTLRKSQTIAATGPRTFGLTGVRVGVDTRGGLSALQVDRRDVDHAAATYNTRTGRHFVLTPVGGSYALTVTLPHTLQNLSRVEACRFDGAQWDCGVDGVTATTVSRAGVDALAQAWAVGFDGACTLDAECESFACVGGFCCINSCTGTCLRCDQRPEQCEFVAGGEDPRDECVGTGTCGGTCDGAGACAFPDASVECAAPSCSEGVWTPAATCSGSGTCAAPTTVSCGGYACAGDACGTSCLVATDCASGYTCNVGTGACVQSAAPGAVCSDDAQCASGSCAGGRCCTQTCAHADPICGGSCDATGACAYPTTAVGCGTCQVCDGQGACLGTPTDDAACGEIDCDILDSACADHADVTTNRCLSFGKCKSAPADCTARTPRNLGASCGASLCQAGSATLQQCDAAGDCVLVAQSCYPYVCDGDACFTACTSDAQCAADRECNTALGTCGAEDGDACSDDDQCGSGHCVDGVCCATACDGLCERCDATAGTCTAIGAGQDPDGECTGTGTCGGTCDGQGACQFADDDVLCDLCTACDGQGACSAVPADDPACGTIACSALTTDCRIYSDLSANRCAAAGTCVTPSVLVCTVFSEVADGTACACEGGGQGACDDGECDCGGVVSLDAGVDAGTARDAGSGAPPTAPDGCGCALHATDGRGAGLLTLLATAGIAVVRRRRPNR